MMRTTLTAALLASGLAFAAPAFAETAPMVGGAPMMADKTIVENASKASNLTTLVAAVKAAGLADTLSGKGPFTVFAPTNAAFAKLPAGTVDTLLKPDMKKTLTGVLTYHVVPGKLDAKDLMAKAKMGGADANLKTVEGQVLTVKMDGDRLALIDQKGGGAFVEQADVFQLQDERKVGVGRVRSARKRTHMCRWFPGGIRANLLAPGLSAPWASYSV